MELLVAIDRDGNLIDSLLSQTRDLEAAKKFFAQALAVEGHPPERVTTDGHDAYPRVIHETLGNKVIHRCNRYLNSRLEQDHRGIKQRTRPMLSFKRFVLAEQFCRVYEEVRDFFRVRSRWNESVSLAWPRALHVGRLRVLMTTLAVA